MIESDEGPVPFRGIWELEADGGATSSHGRCRPVASPSASRTRSPPGSPAQELAADTLRLKRLLEQTAA